MPTVLLATEPFAGLARQVGESYGFVATRIAVVDHPLGGIPADAVRERASRIVETVLAQLVAGRVPH